MEYALLAAVVIMSILIGGATVRKAVRTSPSAASQVASALQFLEQIAGPDPNSPDTCLQTMREDTAHRDGELACGSVLSWNAITPGTLAQGTPPSAIGDLRGCCAAAW